MAVFLNKKFQNFLIKKNTKKNLTLSLDLRILSLLEDSKIDLDVVDDMTM